jgi:anti-sigma B factor antagonist
MRYNVTVTEAAPSLVVDEIPGAGTDVAVLALRGELDLASIEVLRTTVSAYIGRSGHIVLDLSEMTFCDSTGLGTFVGLHRQSTGAGGRLSLAAPRRRVDDLLKLSGIDRVIPVFATAHQALSDPGRPAAD